MVTVYHKKATTVYLLNVWKSKIAPVLVTGRE